MAMAQRVDAEMRQRLRRAGLPTDPDRFVTRVFAALEGVRAQTVGNAVSQLSEADVAELRAIGLDPDAAKGAYAIAAGQTAEKMAAIFADALTVEEAAASLKVTPGRVRQMLNDGSLYGMKVEAGWLIPAFEFANGELVRNIRTVNTALRPGLHPVAVFNWFTLPDQGLRIENVPVSPREWLLSGGDPERVARSAAEL